MKPPWTPLGIGWLLAAIVVVIIVLGLLHAIALSGELIAVSILMLALAILL